MQTQATPKASRQILNSRQVVQLIGLSAATIWRLRRRGDFPEPVALSPGRVGWSAVVIDQWLATRDEVGR